MTTTVDSSTSMTDYACKSDLGRQSPSPLPSSSSSSLSATPAWQSQLISPEQRLSSLLQSSRLADLTITFPAHDTVTIKAHRMVLAMSSPVFEAMLYGPLAEGPEICLQEDPVEAFQWLLQYMYRGTIQLPGVALAVQVYQLASKYQIEPLMDLCSMHLRSTLTASNLPEMYDTAVLLEDTKLLQRCAQVVNGSPAAVLTSPQLGRLSRGALTHLLKQPLHIATEVVLLRALLHCCKINLKENLGDAVGCSEVPCSRQIFSPASSGGTREYLLGNKKDFGMTQDDFFATRGSSQQSNSPSSGESLRQVIVDFLPQVRFLSMSTDEFVEEVLPSGVLTLEEASAILLNMREVGNTPLPSFCSLHRDKRLLYENHLLRSITLTTLHNFPRSRKSARGSIFVHSSHEQILISNLRSATTLQLGKIESKAINPTSGSATVSVKDSSGVVLESATSQGHEVLFDEPVTLQGEALHSVTVCMEGHWPRGELGDFLASEDEVRLEGKVAFTEGRSGAVTLYFWSFN